MKKRLATGRIVLAKVEMIKYTLDGYIWSRLSYEVNGEVFTKEMEVSNNLNNKTGQILLNPKNNKKFIILEDS